MVQFYNPLLSKKPGPKLYGLTHLINLTLTCPNQAVLQQEQKQQLLQGKLTPKEKSLIMHRFQLG